MGRTISFIILCSLCVLKLNATDLRSELRAIYESQVGVTEATNHNDGAEVRAYLQAAGLDEGNPYCAAFVKWCFTQVGLNIPYLTGYSGSCCNESNTVWRIGVPNLINPLPGSVFWWKREGGGHSGFINRWGDRHTFTVEGNVKTQSGKGGVEAKIRLTNSFVKVADPLADYIPEDTTSVIHRIEDLITPEPPVTRPEELPKVEEADKINTTKLAVVIILLVYIILTDDKSEQ